MTACLLSIHPGTPEVLIFNFNRVPVEHVPTPDELKVMGRPKKAPKESPRHKPLRYRAHPGPTEVSP
jgi:hypothetical protein